MWAHQLSCRDSLLSHMFQVAWWRFKAEWLGIMPPMQEESQ